MKDVIARLKEHQSPTPSKWRERAEWRMQNKSWLRHSQRIAVKMLEKMDELSMTQKQLADLMGCSQQYVSKVLKGQENLSLETMSKIEDCLHISILQETGDGIKPKGKEIIKIQFKCQNMYFTLLL